MPSPTIPAQRERSALCDLFAELGPDAPTLCGTWTTRDLAAHLVLRERRPDGAVGILVSKLAGHTEKIQASIAATEWDELIERVRSGPPAWSPMRISAIDTMANTVEFFVHHEDVRRAQPDWTTRDLEADLVAALTKMVPRLGKSLTRSSAIGVVLEPTDGDAAGTPIMVNKAMPSVSVRGPMSEITMFVYGRQLHSHVDLLGDLADIDAVRTASFGV
jgi:uncharacterized protein (TIGR03085 family)